MDPIKKALELMKEIRTLEQQSGELVDQLEKSLKVRELWPEAFALGSVTSKVTGNPHRQLTFQITRKDGSFRHFDLFDVPVMLWPATVVEDMARHGANPNYRRLLKEAKGAK